MEKYLEILKKCPLFCEIEDENLFRMLHCLGARVEKYDKKYTVFSEGSPALCIGIVLCGSVQTVQFDYCGNRNILSHAHASEVFAEEFACASVQALPVSVVAAETCEVLLLDCLHILQTCHNHCGFHQQLIYNMMKILATKNLILHKRIEITSKRSTREKLLTYLMAYAKSQQCNEFDIPFDRQELADYLEVDRSGLSAEIGRLRAEGVLESNKNHFRLL